MQQQSSGAARTVTALRLADGTLLLSVPADAADGGTLSWGYVGLAVALAAALIGKPELLILDEPTSGLDPVSTKEVKTLVKALAKGGMTVLTTSHLLADAEDICDRVMILDRGRAVAQGRVDELDSSLEDFFLAKVGDADAFVLADFLA